MSKRLLVSFALCLLLCTPASADELTAQKSADIKALFQVSGGVAAGKQIMAYMAHEIMEGLRRASPSIDGKAFEVVEQELIAFVTEKYAAPGGALDRLVPVYAETFTHSEIKELLAFYNTPVGKKSVRCMSGLFLKGQRIGEAYAHELGPEIRKMLDAALASKGLSLGKKGQVTKTPPPEN